MSTTKALIEINSIKYNELITIVNKDSAKHLEEVPFGNFQLELNLCDEVYDYAEKIGHCKCYSAHVNGVYAGYIIVMASEMLHHKGIMQGVSDSFYIKHKFRSTGVFKELISYVEDDMRDNGIRFLTVGANPNTPNADKVNEFFHTRGYSITEIALTKEL